MTGPRWREAALLVREGVGVLAGRDYFHARQLAGHYLSDRRCYYNDLGAKTDWRGGWRDGVPALSVARLGETVSFPIMILQYGLGHLDRYFLTGDRASCSAVAAVARWIYDHLAPEGAFDNLFPVLSPGHAYHSANSAMAQGQALSFLARVVGHDVPVELSQSVLVTLLERIRANMVLPLEAGGTALADGADVRYCEVCREDRYVVLNGWIFALFGLRDYDVLRAAEPSREYRASEATLRLDLATYVRQDGWSNYDNQGTFASPFYHDLHVQLLTAMSWLSEYPSYAATAWRFAAADRPVRRWTYAVRKAHERWRSTGRRHG